MRIIAHQINKAVMDPGEYGIESLVTLLITFKIHETMGTGTIDFRKM